MNQRKKTEAAVADAENKWRTAPPHIRAMAARYVEPTLEALKAINEELRHLGGGKSASEGVGNGS